MNGQHADGIRRRQTKTGPPVLPKILAVNKSALRDAILQKLRADLAVLTAAALMARDEAISEESRPENKWDTHSQEAAYLAEGQAKLAADLAASIELYATQTWDQFGPDDAAAVGALVGLAPAAGSGKKVWYFLGPKAGGIEVELDGAAVLVLTPSSPLGRLLLGKRRGENVPLPGRGNKATPHAITDVA